MSIAYLFKSRFLLPFKPAGGINTARLPLYKVVVINAGNSPENQLLIKRLTDDKDFFISYKQIENDFFSGAAVDRHYQLLGFKCQMYDKYVEITRNDPFILSN